MNVNASSSPQDVISNPALAPWDSLEAEAFWFLFHTSPSDVPDRSAYGETEAALSPYLSPELGGTFAGGLGTVQILRYKKSPVGPYDELIYIPGGFNVPALNATKRLRITRIYVSSPASSWNGRRNWNIPKHVTTFNFVPAPEGWTIPYQRIEVGGDEATGKPPFFAVDLKDAAWGLTMPFSTAIAPMNLELMQPPLPQGNSWELAGTEDWCCIVPDMKGSVGGIWNQGGLEGGEWGDGVGFPKVHPWSLGLWWREVRIDFPEGTPVNGESEPKPKWNA